MKFVVDDDPRQLLYVCKTEVFATINDQRKKSFLLEKHSSTEAIGVEYSENFEYEHLHFYLWKS